MKNTLYLIVFLILASCQQEINEISGTEPGPNTNNNSSELTLKLRNIASSDGSIDDFIDFSPCFSIMFPFQVEVDDDLFTVATEDDYQLVRDAIAINGDDEVELIFPVTIQQRDFTEITISDDDDFEDLQEDCEVEIANNGAPITCINLNYPIEISTFNTRLQIINTINISNDMQLLDLIDNIDDDEFYEIAYPITVVSSGTDITINDDDALEDIVDSCVEDDVSDDSDDIAVFFDDDSYIIENFTNAGVDQTADFDGFTIEFEDDDNSMVVENENNPPPIEISGVYTITNEAFIIITLDFTGSSLFEQLDAPYRVISFTESRIVMRRLNDPSTRLVLIEED